MIAAVYGLQVSKVAIKLMVDDHLHLEARVHAYWMDVLVHLSVSSQSTSANPSFPIYSIYLPLYSFWSMDDFSWGNTRQVVGEGNNKTVLYEDDEVFTDDMIPYKSFKGESYSRHC